MNRTAVRLVLFAVLAAGCGKKSPSAGVEVRGRLMENGKPLKIEFAGVPPGLPPAEVVFMPEGFPGADHVAAVNPADATFVVRGAGEAPLTPGRYRIAVQVNGAGKDRLKGKFDRANTPITRVVAAGQEELVIDLAKP